jgi:integrase/recombinase XerD
MGFSCASSTATYALRTSEICNLLLGDVDFKEGVITIRRCKSQLTQRMPLTKSVARALQDYLAKARPICDCREFFVKLRMPYGRVQQSSIYYLVKIRMQRLRIKSVNRGAHALRHACANRLLRTGSSVPKVADLLGHSGTKYVGWYIQHSVDELRSISDFRIDLSWI